MAEHSKDYKNNGWKFSPLDPDRLVPKIDPRYFDTKAALVFNRMYSFFKRSKILYEKCY